MALAEEKFISFTTYRKTGAAVATATWITGLDNGQLGLWTSSESGKAKRLRNDSRVTLQPSDSRGRVKPGSSPVVGTATVIQSGPLYDAVQRQIRAKYGAMVHISRLFNTVAHLGRHVPPYGDVVVLITPDA